MRRAVALGLLVLTMAARPADGRAPQTIKLRFPRFAVPAGAASEVCYFVRVPTAEPFDLASWEIRNQGARGSFGAVHFIVSVYRGERLAEFAPDAGRTIASRGCLDLGPPDRDRRQIIALGASARVRGQPPPGVAIRLSPVPAEPGGPPDGLGFLMSANWQNGDARTHTASARVILRRARAGTVRRLAHPFIESTAELGIEMPAGQITSTESSTAAFNAGHPGAPPLQDAWGAGLPDGPAGDACVASLTGHTHRRVRFFGVDFLGADGLPQNPPNGTTNPFEAGRSHLFGAVDFTDPGVLTFTRPLLVRADERLHYACWIDHGLTRPLRLGCEETAGVAPGRAQGDPSGGAAKPCNLGGANPDECPPEDAAYPGRSFSRTCVVANAVAGITPDDEACALTGIYFDAVAGAPSGMECDVNGLPPLP